MLVRLRRLLHVRQTAVILKVLDLLVYHLPLERGGVSVEGEEVSERPVVSVKEEGELGAGAESTPQDGQGLA
eukprot:5365796-Pyramimonas_sp.AAC.1